MITANIAEVDVALKEGVLKELEWDPDLDASAVAVAAVRGTVTLTGFIDSYFGKLAAERAAKRVAGVRAVANDIQVRFKFERTDPEIAEDAARALNLHAGIPRGVQATVHDGHLTLTGSVEWLSQKREAEAAVCHIRGLRHVINHIVVESKTAERDVRRRIVRALHRNADVDARHITVAIDNDIVTLSGTVGTWLQREAAERAAASAPGIGSVENQLGVEPPHPQPHAGMEDAD